MNPENMNLSERYSKYKSPYDKALPVKVLAKNLTLEGRAHLFMPDQIPTVIFYRGYAPQLRITFGKIPGESVGVDDVMGLEIYRVGQNIAFKLIASGGYSHIRALDIEVARAVVRIC